MTEPHELMGQLLESLMAGQSRLVMRDIEDSNKSQLRVQKYKLLNLTRQVLRIVEEHLKFGNPLFMSIGTAQIYLVDRRADAGAECSQCHVGLFTWTYL